VVESSVIEGLLDSANTIQLDTSSVSLRKLRIDKGAGSAVRSNKNVTLHVSDTVINRSSPLLTDQPTFVAQTGTLFVERTWVMGSTRDGFSIGSNGDPLESLIKDTLISGVVGHEGGGEGISHFGGNLQIRQVRVEDCNDYGIRSSGDGPDDPPDL